MKIIRVCKLGLDKRLDEMARIEISNYMMLGR